MRRPTCQGVGAGVAYEQPLGLVFNTVNPILAQGATFGGLTMLAGFDEDVTACVPHGAQVEIDPVSKILRIL